MKEMHKTLPATGKPSGWSIAEDIGSKYDFSINYFRTKFLGSNGVPISFCAYQQPLTEDDNDPKTFKTADSIAESHDALFDKMKVSRNQIDKHLMGIHGDGQIEEWDIAGKVQKKQGFSSLMSK